MAETTTNRRLIAIKGIVQGVGFRPFVYNLARRHGLNGFVRNDNAGVWIEVEGKKETLDRFTRELKISPPVLAVVDELSWKDTFADTRGADSFYIDDSLTTRDSAVFISPDYSTCDECLREMRDPKNRRYKYPFLNCTHCGPRMTIVTSAPYDRERTTMAVFDMCADCRREYHDPQDRRFHAQPNACPRCGPRLQIVAGDKVVETPDPIAFAARALCAGKICALKGLGGFHLVCDARNSAAVQTLRSRKHRDEKPFAIMVSNVDEAERLCEISTAERELLLSNRRPIVLLCKKSNSGIAEEVAFGNPSLGIMLPYTPLHYLLLDECRAPLVMTSGNISDDPIAYSDKDASARLAEIADFFLTHNRPIHLRCDDSVLRVIDEQPLPLRRSRGFAPAPLKLPISSSLPILALGGQMKNTFALGRGRNAFLSHHIGDLDHYEAYRAFGESISHFQNLFEIQTEILVHDLHPDYSSTQFALKSGLKRFAVQHHHAHLAACMADNSLNEPVIGVIFDGTGLGTDGTIWGGEFLTGDYRSFERWAHFRNVGMPGGESAVREPWRMAVAQLLDAGLDLSLLQSRISQRELNNVAKLLEGRLNSASTSSCGRLFDAVAALVGVRDRVSYEGQAAVELEGLAASRPPCGAYSFKIDTTHAPFQIDPRPAIVEIRNDVGRVETSILARRWHSTLVSVIEVVCESIRSKSKLNAVVLSGGVFMNAILLRESLQALSARGFRVYRHRQVPPNDGGLSLGQLAIAAATLKHDENGYAHK